MNTVIPAESTVFRQRIVNLIADLMATDTLTPESYKHGQRANIEARLADEYASLESAEYRETHGYR